LWFILVQGQAQEFISETSNSASGAIDSSGSVFRVCACAWVYVLADVKARACIFYFKAFVSFALKEKKMVPFWLVA